MAMTLDQLRDGLDAAAHTLNTCLLDPYIEAIAHLSAQAKVRVTVTDDDVDNARQAAYDVPDISNITRKAMRAALESFATRLSQGAQNNVSDNNERMCCSGAECGCQGVTKGQWRAHLLAKQLSHGDAVGDVYWEHADGESEMRVNWFGDPPPVGTMLYTHPAERAVVPDGWKLVPKELTLSMSVRGKWALCDHTIKPEDFKRAWREMLTAAPQPPEGARVGAKHE